MTKIDFKNLKLKEIYNWPVAVQAMVGVIVFFIVLALGVFFSTMDQYSTLDGEKDKEVKLKQDYVDKIHQAVNLNLYKQQLVEITQASDDLLKQLPNRSEVEKLLIDINQAGISRGLQFELFKPDAEKINEFYAELPIEIKVDGSYNAIGQFASDVSRLSRVVILKNINIVSAPNDQLVMTATAQTFRYLDQEELDKKKAEERKAKKAKQNNNNKNEG